MDQSLSSIIVIEFTSHYFYSNDTVTFHLSLFAYRFGIPSLGTTDHCYQTFGSDPITIPTLSPRTIYYAPNNTDNGNKYYYNITGSCNELSIL